MSMNKFCVPKPADEDIMVGLKPIIDIDPWRFE